jgi:hypothetical protein
MTMDEVVQADGSYTTLFHVERLATNQSAAQKIAQQTVEYSENMETADIDEALTRKADGNILKVGRGGDRYDFDKPSRSRPALGAVRRCQGFRLGVRRRLGGDRGVSEYEIRQPSRPLNL